MNSDGEEHNTYASNISKQGARASAIVARVRLVDESIEHAKEKAQALLATSSGKLPKSLLHLVQKVTK